MNDAFAKEQARAERRRAYHREYHRKNRNKLLLYHREYNRRRRANELPERHYAGHCSCCGRPISEETIEQFNGMGPTCAAGLCNCHK